MNQETDIPSEKAVQSGGGKRYLRARRVFQSLRKRSRRLLLGSLLLAAAFASLAIIQHWFVHAQLYRTTGQQLGAWAAQVVDEIAYKDKWDLGGYRQASIIAPSWNVLTKDGHIIDLEGFIPGLFGTVEPLDESVYSAPNTVKTEVGEKWRLFGRKFLGGLVIVGICSPENETDADTKLLANAAKFGSTLEQALSVRSREIDFEVDYAVVSSTGELKAAWGGIPLKANPRAVPISSDHMAPFDSSGKSYLLYFQRVLDGRGQDVGTIIIPKEMGFEQNALKAQDRFNVTVIGLAALFAFLTALWLIVHEFFVQSKRVTLEEALKVGESRTIEFKSTFQWDLRLGKQVEERRLDTLKSIAGFLNAKGGTLFIGITEDNALPTLRGLNEDLNLVGGSRDRLQRTLRDLVTTRIGPQFSPFIADSLEETAGLWYWVIGVEESLEPAFVRWKPAGESKEQKKFYVREGPKTSDLDNESTWHYIKNRWG